MSLRLRLGLRLHLIGYHCACLPVPLTPTPAADGPSYRQQKSPLPHRHRPTEPIKVCPVVTAFASFSTTRTTMCAVPVWFVSWREKPTLHNTVHPLAAVRSAILHPPARAKFWDTLFMFGELLLRLVRVAPRRDLVRIQLGQPHSVVEKTAPHACPNQQ